MDEKRELENKLKKEEDAEKKHHDEIEKIKSDLNKLKEQYKDNLIGNATTKKPDDYIDALVNEGN